MQQLIDSKTNIKNEILSGLTIALSLVPEAIAFAFLLGLNPMVGIYTAVIIGVVTAFFGGRPGMISGATGAIASVYVLLVANHGVEYLYAAVILAGCFQILAGIFKLGKFSRFIPHPVMLGFVNGLAVIILKAQFKPFKVDGEWLSTIPLVIMFALAFITMGIIHFFPKLTKTVPSTLVAIFVTTIISIALASGGLDIITVGDYAGGSIKGGLADMFSRVHIPAIAFNVDTLMIILPYSITAAIVGLIESLLTLELIDEMTESRGKANKECIGQGLANIASGFFGGIGGCALIGQSMVNINSNGRKYLSGLVGAIGLLFIVLFGSSVIAVVPMAALVGVMFMVVIETFAWESLSLGKKIPKTDIFTILVVMFITIFIHNLALAVFTGVIISALVFAWKKGKKITASTRVEGNKKIYILNGPLFFGSASSFKELFTIGEDPQVVSIDFTNTQVMDHSAIEALANIIRKYQKANKELHLLHLSDDCKALLKGAEKIIKVDILADKDYHVASNILD